MVSSLFNQPGVALQTLDLDRGALWLDALAQMQVDQAQNVANGSTGYKRIEHTVEGATFSLPDRPDTVTLPQVKTYIQFEQGPLLATENPLHLALSGPGFFKAQSAQGGTIYLRNGRCSWNTQGQWVTAQGHALMAQGAPLTLDRSLGVPEIRSDGSVWQSGQMISQLDIMETPQPTALQPQHGGFVLAADAPEQAAFRPSLQTQVQQGYVEESNHSPILGSVRMIEIHRNFEATKNILTKVADKQTDLLSKLNPTQFL